MTSLSSSCDLITRGRGDGNPSPSAFSPTAGLETHLTDACIGQLSEIFDAQEPHHARGCVAQAWSVAEFLRTWARIDAAARRTGVPPPTFSATRAAPTV